MTTYSKDGCGGYKVWIELEVNNKTCNTKEIPDFSAGNTLLWFGKYLGSCRDFEFEKDWEQINFRVKENNTGDNFCPTYLYVFVDGEGENDITFKSNEMYTCSTCTTYDYQTNDRNHIARKLPQSGKSVDTFILLQTGDFYFRNFGLSKSLSNHLKIHIHGSQNWFQNDSTSKSKNSASRFKICLINPICVCIEFKSK